MGVVEYNGAYYINLVAGNTEVPTLGTSNGTYAGGYEYLGLMNKIIEMYLATNASVLNPLIDARLKAHGLIKG